MHHTEMEITFKANAGKHKAYIVPAKLARKVQVMLQHELDWLHRDRDGFVPAEEALPELNDPVKGPARSLRVRRRREELTQKELAEILGIRQHHLSEMENGKRPIGKAMAKKLASALNTDWKMFV